MNTLKRRWVGPVALALPLLATSACTGRDVDAHQAPGAAGEAIPIQAVAHPDSSSIREIWMALADEPGTHMRLARLAYEAGRREDAARELDKSASLFRWGRYYTTGERDRRDFTASAQELEEAARVMRQGSARGPEPLEHVLALGYRALAEHHVSAALPEWEAGEHVRVALLLAAAATEVERGFALSGQVAGGSIDAAVAAARAASDRLESKQPPTEVEVRDAIRDLQTAAHGLGEVLGSRRH